MKPELPILTRAEAEVMHALWTRGRATVHEVVEALPRALAYTTVLTMLRVLEQKGYVSHAPSPEGGRAHVYFATQPEERVRRSHLRDFVDRLFGGQPEEAMIGLLSDERLSRAELEALRAQIDRALAAKKTRQGRR